MIDARQGGRCKTLFYVYNQCRREIIAFPKRALFTLDYLRLILIYNVPKTTAWAHERVIQAK